jgi:hypothetical protein
MLQNVSSREGKANHMQEKITHISEYIKIYKLRSNG